MNYGNLNIFKKDKFELGSKNRKETFRFIRYNGANYDEIVNYIHELSPNTVIWPEDRLKPGYLYNYSGRNGEMSNVDDVQLRAVIVNNPYLIESNGNRTSIMLTKKQATEYLEQSEIHAVFYADSALSTYKRNNKNQKIKVYNREHPKGYEILELHEDQEYYICSNICSHPEYYICRYEKDLHNLSISVNVYRYVDKMEELKYLINNSFLTIKDKYFFTPSINYWNNYKTLSKNCMNSRMLNEIVRTIASIVFNSTDNLRTIKEARLDKHEFIKTLTIAKDHDYDNKDNIPQELIDIIIKYTSNDDFYCPNDYHTFQIRLYSDFIDFLNNILESVRKPKSGIIHVDEISDIVCCSGTQLSPNYKKFKGLKCSFCEYTLNTNHSLPNSITYYCKKIDYVFLEKEGTVCIDDNEKLYIDCYKFPKHTTVKVGDYVKITKIRPLNEHNGRNSNNPNPYIGLVIDYTLPTKNKSEFLKHILIKEDLKKEEFLAFLHNKIKGFRNTEAAKIIIAGREAGLISKEVTFLDINREFNKIINVKQTYSRTKETYTNSKDKIFLELIEEIRNWDTPANAQSR